MKYLFYLLLIFFVMGACTRECPQCSGLGEEACHRCYGTGDEACTQCSGDGEVACSWCYGKGYKDCSSCSGRGYASGYGYGYTTRGSYEYFYGDHKCTSCDGTGKAKCFTCYGEGTQDCSFCGHDGKNTCTNCHGNKKQTCTLCSGNTFIEDKRSLNERFNDFFGIESKPEHILTKNEELQAPLERYETTKTENANLLTAYNLSSKTRAELSHEDLVAAFLISLSNRDYQTAYNLTWVDRFEQKGEEWFVSCEAYGCTHDIQLLSLARVDHNRHTDQNGTQTFEVTYTAQDNTNGAGSYTQLFTVSPKGEQAALFITNIKNKN